MVSELGPDNIVVFGGSLVLYGALVWVTRQQVQPGIRCSQLRRAEAAGPAARHRGLRFRAVQ
jgi:hypothetical protein